MRKVNDSEKAVVYTFTICFAALIAALRIPLTNPALWLLCGIFIIIAAIFYATGMIGLVEIVQEYSKRT